MIKRTVEISREPAHLAVKLEQLQLRRGSEVVASIPCEDLGMLVVDHPQTTYTHAALAQLMASDTVVVICGRDHLPSGMLLPLADHSQVAARLRLQIGASQPIQKRLWQQVVRAKILGQARNLAPDSSPFRRLQEFANTVRSGDPDNREAQAAKTYWSAWLLQSSESLTSEKFCRDPDGVGLNALLNYGYAIMRAAIARAIVAAGLHPAIGIKHSNRSNGFCLADDLIEPLRPLVDRLVRSLAERGESELTQTVKGELLTLLTEEVSVGNTNGPLMVSLHRYLASFVDCLTGHSKDLEVPIPCTSAVTAACGL